MSLASLSGIIPSFAQDAGRDATVEMIPPDAMHIDGVFEESFYTTARWASYPAAKPESGAFTRFSLHLDNSYLYVSASIATSDGEALAKITTRDGGLSTEDSVEVFLQCGADPSEGYQFIVNALGTLADYQLVQGGLLGAGTYHADLSVATRCTSEGWQFEMAIPLAQLEIAPSRGKWGLQLATNQAPRKGKKSPFHSWVPVLHSLRTLGTFGALTLPDQADFSRFAWRLYPQKPAILLRDGEYFLQTRVEVQNDTPHYRIAELSIAPPGQPLSTAQKVALAPGKRSFVTVDTPLGEVSRLSGQLVYRLSETAPGQGLLKQIGVPVDLQYTPWELQLIAPGYRQTIFATQKLSHLRARLKRTDPEIASEQLNAKLVTAEGKELIGTFSPIEQHEWEITIAGIDALPDGKHRLHVSIGEGKSAFSLEREITKLPYQKGEVWIDALGIVRREGVAIPFYGYCFGYWSGMEKEWVPEFEPNLAGPVGAWGENEERFEVQNATIAHLKSIGIYSIADVATATEAHRSGGPRRKSYGLTPLTESEKQEYRTSIDHLKGNPAVVAYYLADEPELNNHSPRRLGEVSSIYRKEDPYKPILIVNNTFNGLIDYLPTSDIPMPDRYPIFRKNSGSSSSIKAIELHLNAIPLGQEPYRARWATLQAFDYSQVNIPDARGPSAREMRSQQISALIGGATGITWYRQTDVYDIPGILSSLAYLEKEFRWVFETRQQTLPRAVKDQEGQLQCAILEGETGPILLVVNPEWETVTARIGDPLLKAHTRWKKVGTSEALSSKAGALTLKLEPHESTLLIPDSMPMPDLDWLAVEQMEARLHAEAVVKGNIAHLSTGTIARVVAQNAPYPYTAATAIDGMKSPRARGHSRRPFKVGEGVELEFPGLKRPKRLLLYGSNITKGRIEVSEGGQWEKVASFEGTSSPEPLEILLPGKETAKLRLIAEELDYRFLSNEGKIIEMEVYE